MTLPLPQIGSLVGILWDCLLDLDDLSSSTNSIMELMGTLLSSPSDSSPTPDSTPSPDLNSTPKGQEDLHALVPRLWPFLNHMIGSVRKSSLRVLLTLLDLGDGDPSPTVGGHQGEVKVQGVGWLRVVLRTLLCQLFQRFALEGDQEIQQLLHKVLGIGF